MDGWVSGEHAAAPPLGETRETASCGRSAIDAGSRCRRASHTAQALEATRAAPVDTIASLSRSSVDITASRPAVIDADVEQRGSERRRATRQIRRSSIAVGAATEGRRCAALVFAASGETTMERVELTIEGMTCEHCVRAVRGRLERTPGVKVEDVQVGSATLQYDAATTSLDDVE